MLKHILILHPGRLTWNIQITHLERKMIFQTSMIMFHVNLQGCIIYIFTSWELSPSATNFWTNQPTNDPVLGFNFGGRLRGTHWTAGFRNAWTFGTGNICFLHVRKCLCVSFVFFSKKESWGGVQVSMWKIQHRTSNANLIFPCWRSSSSMCWRSKFIETILWPFHLVFFIGPM